MQTTTMYCENSKGKSFWMKLAHDQTLWNKIIFDQSPSVIAHEYKRLQDELAHNHPFAAMLQLKDIMEALLKFEVLLAYSWAGQSGVNHFREKVECIITTRSLSMGAWMELAKEIINFFKPGKTGVFMPDILYQPLSLVRKFYNKHEFVNWRNEAIGHGALAFAEDEDFRKDIREKLLLIRQLFKEIESYLKEQNIQADGGKLILMGSENASGLPLKEGKVFFASEVQNLYFELSPYMYIREGSVYFFDNQKKPKRTQRLCYTTGGRRNEEDEYFSKLDTIREEQGLKMDLEAASGFIVASEEKFLNQLGMESSFVEPKHLISWLQKEINKAEKGIYLLKMPRGTGKSTFTEKLNRLYDKPLEVADDMDVRTYHLSRTQVRNKSDFERGIETQWSLAYQQDPWTAYKRMVDYRNEGCEPAEAFAEYLRQVLDFTDRRRGRERILMVCDGLDEIAESAVWEYIPRAEQLPDGVYILLTSRDPELEKGLPEALSERLNRLDIQGGMTVRADSPENIEFLKKYATQDGSIQENQIDRLLELAQNRVLYLGMYLTLLRSGLEMNELPEAQKLCGSFMEEIEKKYGEKKVQRLHQILCVLSGVGRFEPLRLKEIAELSDQDGVTFELLGVMNDLRSVLKVDRGYAVAGRQYIGENRYTLVNTDIAGAMFDLLPEAKQMVKDSVLDTLKEIEGMPKEEKITDGMLITLSYAADLLAMSSVNEADYPKITDRLGRRLLKGLYDRHELQVLILDRLKKVYLWLLKIYPQNPHVEYDRAIILIRLGDVYDCHCEAYKALEMYNKACMSLEELYSAGRLTNRNVLATVYNNIARTLASQQKLDEALEMYEKARKIREELDAENLLPDRNSLATVYNNIASALKSQQKFDEALEMYEKARKIPEELDAEDLLPDRNFLATVYNNIASALESQQKFDEALEMYNKACMKLEELYSAGRLTNRNVLATVYNNIALALESQQKFDEALEMYEKARKIQEELDVAGCLPDRNDLATVYNNIGCALESQQKFDEALEIWDKARTIREELDAVGCLPDRNDLATVYNNIGYALESQKKLDKVLEIWDKVRTIREELDAAGCLPDRNDLATVYNNIGYALESQKKLDEALEMYDKARIIREGLDVAGRLPDRYGLAALYNNIARILHSQKKLDEALAMYDKACAIMEELDAVGRLPYRDSLARTYCEMAFILVILSRHTEALHLYDQAVAIQEDLDVAGKLADRNWLATTYNNMAYTMKMLGRPPEALQLYDKGIAIRETLDITGQLKDRTHLVAIYGKAAEVLKQLGREEEAQQYSRKAEAIQKQIDASAF